MLTTTRGIPFGESDEKHTPRGRRQRFRDARVETRTRRFLRQIYLVIFFTGAAGETNRNTTLASALTLTGTDRNVDPEKTEKKHPGPGVGGLEKRDSITIINIS